MEPTVEALTARIRAGWLPDKTQRDLVYSAFEYAGGLLDETDPGELSNGVLVAHHAMTRMAGSWLAALARKLPVFLANPDWKSAQWKEIEAQLSPGLILADEGLPIHPVENPESIGFEGLTMVPTGGSGGSIRFTMHAWAGMVSSARATARQLETETLSSYCVLPLYHVSGLMQLVRSLITDGEVLFGNPRCPNEGTSGMPLNADYGLSLVPTQLTRLLAADKGKAFLRQFGHIFLGGAAPSADLVARIRNASLPVQVVYGMSETASMVAACDLAQSCHSAPLAYTPLPHASFTVEGERLCVEAESLFRGYFPELPRERGSFLTGDRGDVRPDGTLVIHGRADNFVNTGGEKVDPRRVEQTLLDTGLVAEAAVFSRPGTEWGEEVVALLVPRLRQPSSFESVRAGLREVLPGYMVPKRMRWVTALPRTVLGKLDLAAAREILDDPD